MRYARGGISICRYGVKTRNQSLERMGFYDCARFQRTCNSAERLDERALMDDLLHSSRMYIVALEKKKNTEIETWIRKIEMN